MSEASENLRKILAQEQKKNYSDNVVVGGLDAAFLRYAQTSGISTSHPVSRILQSLPPGGYRALHPVQRKRVVEEVLRALDSPGAEDGAPESARPPARVLEFPARPAPKPAKPAVGKQPIPRAAPPTIIGTLDSSVTALPGVGKALETLLAKAKIKTVRDLLLYFPRDYEEYLGQRPINKLEYGKLQTISGEVFHAAGKAARNRKMTEAIISDGTGSVRVVWWAAPWIAKQLPVGRRVTLTGKVGSFRDRLQMDQPEFSAPEVDSVPALLPIYTLPGDLKMRDLRAAIRLAVDAFAGKLEDRLPDEMRARLGLPRASEAVRAVHFPRDEDDADVARRRFAFEELLYIEIGVVRRRLEWQDAGGAPRLTLPEETRAGFEQALPFELTGAQKRAVREVLADIADESPMTRLLEGDVGSGKTAVAAVALLAAVASGYQGAIMAPTEILAEQHFRTLSALIDPAREAAEADGVWFQETGPGYVALRPPYMPQPVRIALLKGSLKASEKTAATEAIAAGEVDIAVGTHALVQEGVAFQRLGLAVVDEQHRFGVEQRASLREKGEAPHVLVMTATPIPRTLALTVYGDLDITVLDEMPPGRPPVKTWRVTRHQRERAFTFVRDKVREGRQAYVICPLVEESEAVQAKAAVQEYERLSRDIWPDLRVGLLHGRMTPSEKDATMRTFRDGELDVLVSTAVVEVGVDVPNATVMLIEGADRFGLSQLHQFRGRVRRSSEQGYCFLLADDPSPEAMERLQIMEEINDGFKLAEEDLRLRGPGEYFGTRQSGMPDLRVAKLTDLDLIIQARAEATSLLKEDPALEQPEHAAMREEVRRVWDRITSEVS